MRNRRRIVATLTLAASLAAGPPARAAVSVKGGLRLTTGPVIETSQRELQAIARPGTPTRRLGRLPRNASLPFPDGPLAWSVTLGEHDPREVRLFRIDPGQGRLETLRPSPAGLEGPVQISGVAGADPLFVYLRPDLRYRKRDGLLQRGHLETARDLEVLQTESRGEETWYLARDRAEAGPGPRRLWLLYSLGGGPAWARAEAGEDRGCSRLAMDGSSVYLIQDWGRILRFGRASLRLEEDLTPMLRPGRIGFFSADEHFYWVQVGAREDGSGGDLWKVDRDVLDGAPVRLAAIPDGSAPFADDGERIWFASLEERTRRPLLSARKADGSTQAYAITGRHARHWREFGRGAAQGTIIGMEAAVVIVLSPVLLLVAITGGLG